MSIERLLTVICADDLPALRDFYTGLLGMSVTYESDGYLHLACPGNQAVEIAFEHPAAPGPGDARGRHYFAIAVDDVDAVCRKAEALGADILEKPRHGEYDRYRLLLRDPAGTLLEIFTPSDPGEAEMSEYMRDV